MESHLQTPGFCIIVKDRSAALVTQTISFLSTLWVFITRNSLRLSSLSGPSDIC